MGILAMPWNTLLSGWPGPLGTLCNHDERHSMNLRRQQHALLYPPPSEIWKNLFVASYSGEK